MSIVGTTLLFLTMKALNGATLAGDEIDNTPVDPFASDFQGVAKPMVAVFIGNDQQTVQGKDLSGGDRSVDITIQAFLPTSVEILVDGNPVSLNARGAGGDLAMGMFERQIKRALTVGGDEAGDLWRTLVLTVESIETQSFLFQTANKALLMAREITLSMTTMQDPDFGQQTLSRTWERILALFEADEDYTAVAPWIRAEMTAPESLEQIKIIQGQLGVANDVMTGVGLEAIEFDPDALPVASFTLVEEEDAEVLLNEQIADAAEPPTP